MGQKWAFPETPGLVSGRKGHWALARGWGLGATADIVPPRDNPKPGALITDLWDISQVLGAVSGGSQVPCSS